MKNNVTIIEAKQAPGAISPYSQGYVAGDFVFTSGQIPVDPATGTVPEGITAQAHQSCRNVAAVLEAGGAGLESVLKTTCFLADMADFAAFNAVYAESISWQSPRAAASPSGSFRRVSSARSRRSRCADKRRVILIFN